ncbi:hypothetical protein BKA70DRAFT_1260518 [Coprinopsis sp. MPI-PUGE-AT-0042]|nr:hypothetical protein BKA70DRAFT_1260518 [Coprinopsis sp. MPI-PUGE-AT-0042]
MLAARSALRCSTRSLPRSLTTQRDGSSSSHHHHTEGEADYRVPEGFGNTVWRNTVLAGLAIVAFYKYAPEPSENVYLTRWIAMYSRSREDWLNFNAVHTAASQESANQSLLFHDAKAPVLRRYRYPQAIGQASPFLNGVGLGVDTSDLVVKTESSV